MHNQVASLRTDMEEKVREGRELTKQLKASKSRVRRLESEVEYQTKERNMQTWTWTK